MAAAKRKTKRAKTKAPDSEELLAYYRQMLLIRRFEEKAGQMYGMGLIGGFCHLYIGQEAVVVGMEHAIGPDIFCVLSPSRYFGSEIRRRKVLTDECHVRPPAPRA